MGYIAGVGDYVCHIPSLGLCKVVEVLEGDKEDPFLRYRVKTDGVCYEVLPQNRCRLLPKVGEKVCILASNWFSYLIRKSKRRESIELRPEEAFWLQQISVLKTEPTASGLVVIESEDKQLKLPYICISSYTVAGQLLSELQKAKGLLVGISA